MVCGCTPGHRADRRRMRKVEEVLKKTKAVPPQSKIEIVRGMHVHRTKGGIPVLSVHYSADPERDPQIHPEWKQTERRTYSSQAAWDREQEMVDEAGGGELVFADTLLTYWDKIVITDPSWRPSPHWRVEGGFRSWQDQSHSLASCLHRRRRCDLFLRRILCGGKG